MLEILVTVPPARDRAARVRIIDQGRTLIDDWGVATTDPGTAARAGNALCDPLRPGGHPAFGRYDLTARGTPPAGTEAEYGAALLLFEPIGGRALDAEAYGRLGLLVHAGQMAPDATMRRTQGSLRLSTSTLGRLLEVLEAATPVELQIEAAAPPPWWAFWRKSRVHPPLSRRPPEHTSPPHDAASLMAELMKTARRRVRPGPRGADDDDRWRDRDTSATASEAHAFRGRGGATAGGGASGSWSDAPAAGRGPGVDSAGRIAAAAGMASAAAAVAAVHAATASAASAAPDAAHGSPDAGNGMSSDTSIPESGSTSPDAVSSTGDSSSDSGWSAGETAY